MALHYYEVLYRGVILFVIHIMTRPAIDRRTSRDLCMSSFTICAESS
jgi:hypothetical protein